jgi:4-hydroxy-tetrahydrodipicolinate synthase
MKEGLHGVVVPVVTPFTSSGDVDEAAFDDHLGRLVRSGVHGILVGDLVGETWSLTVPEKALLFSHAVAVVAHRVPVIAKLSEVAARAQQALAVLAKTAGVDMLKVALPVWPRADDDATYRYLMEAVGAVQLPFMVETDGSDISIEVLDKLAEDRRFVGLEEASQDLERFAALVTRYGGRVPVFCGAEDVLAEHLRMGAAGFMTATPNLAPEFMLAIWEASTHGRGADLIERIARLRRYRELMQPGLADGRPVYATYTKAGLAMIERPVGPPRTPLTELSPPELEALEAALFDDGGLGLPRPSTPLNPRLVESNILDRGGQPSTPRLVPVDTRAIVDELSVLPQE